MQLRHNLSLGTSRRCFLLTEPVHLPPQGGKDIATKPVAFSGSPLQVNVGLPSADGLLDKVPPWRNSSPAIVAPAC